MVEQVGMARQIAVDSAGVSDYHEGDPPDRRAQQAALRRGYDLSTLRARQVSQRDFLQFDYVLAMDSKNLADLRTLYPSNGAAELNLFLAYSKKYPGRDVPDPYFGGTPGFEYVLDQVEDAAEGLLQHLLTRLRAPSAGRS